MNRLRRRDLLLAGAAGVGLGTGAGFWRQRRIERRSRAAESIGAPDFILVNGTVYTVEPDRPVAEAFAVKNGSFIAVGSSRDIRDLARANTKIFDASGMTVTPGYIDCHVHPFSGGVRAVTEVDLDLRSIADAKAALAARAARTRPQDWVLGFKYDDTKYTDGRQLTREDLDEAVPRHPVRIDHRGGHVRWYNSKAFELAGVTPRTPDPPGGRIYKREGKLDGKVAETANRLFDAIVPSGSTREQRRAGVAEIARQMTAAGITTVHEGGTTPDALTAFHDAYDAGELRFRVHMMIMPGAGYEGLKAAGLSSGFGNEWLEIRGLRLGVDGSVSGRTMAMSTPYVGRPDDRGILTLTQEEANEAVEDAHRHGFQITAHANGDVAIEMILNAYERAATRWPRRDARFRIEHCTLVNPILLRRIRELGVIPEPFSTYVHYHGEKWAEYGEEKLRWMFAMRSFLDSGIATAIGSDYVPGPFEPLMGIQSMVTRKDLQGRVWGANQRISVDEAIRCSTYNGARASYQEGVKGSIKAGKFADFVVLADDPHTVDPDAIKHIKVIKTVVGGKTAYEA